MFASQMQHYFSELDSALRRCVAAIDDSAPGFSLMLRYALGWATEHDEPYSGATGKRMRPLLLLLCTEAAGGNWQSALPAAVAVELLHNFSLIHDDIQDNSPIRRGRPTVWKIWGVANAINAGDAMFGLSYAALQQLADTGVDPRTVVGTWRVYNDTILELTRGQHLDMRFETQDRVSVADYVSMIRGKSAALIAACAQMGALIARGDETVARHYADFGLNMGMAFQIRDDILGIWGDPAITGKSAATDILAHKKSLPVLYGLAHTPPLETLYHQTKFSDVDVAETMRFLEQSGARAYALDQEDRYIRLSVQALDAANPTGAAADGLRAFVQTLFGRSY